MELCPVIFDSKDALFTVAACPDEELCGTVRHVPELGVFRSATTDDIRVSVLQREMYASHSSAYGLGRCILICSQALDPWTAK